MHVQICVGHLIILQYLLQFAYFLIFHSHTFHHHALLTVSSGKNAWKYALSKVMLLLLLLLLLLLGLYPLWGHRSTGVIAPGKVILSRNCV